MARNLGMRHGKAKIEFKTIEEIRNKYKRYGARPSILAKEYGISINTIWDWVQYKTRIAG